MLFALNIANVNVRLTISNVIDINEVFLLKSAVYAI